MIPFEIGCDIVQIDRIRLSLAKKILTPDEMIEFDRLSGQRAIEFLAGHFAAKEAIFKTLKQPNIDFKKIEIHYDEHGSPFGYYEQEIIALSISHERDYAMAVSLRPSS